MICGPCTYSQGLGVAFFVTSSSATNLLPPLNGTPTPAQSCESDEMTDGSQGCKCTREMFGCSIHPNTPEKWIASMRGSLARILAQQEKAQAWAREQDRGFTEKFCESLTYYDHHTFSWKMFQQSLITECGQFSEIWPRAGMMLDGVVFGHPMSGLRITEIAGGALPTPTASDWKRVPTKIHYATKPQREGTPDDLAKYATRFCYKRYGWESTRLLPVMSEWMMGFPIEWTGLKRLVMPKFRSKRRQPGACSVAPHDPQPDSAASERREE